MSIRLLTLGFAHVLILSFLLAPYALFAQTSRQDQLHAEHNPKKRAKLALRLASTAFNEADGFYRAGEVHKGDAALDEMTGDLKECLSSLRAAHSGNSYQRAELKVASLERRLHDLVETISIQNRGWAQQTERTVDKIHDQILNGAMKR